MRRVVALLLVATLGACGDLSGSSDSDPERGDASAQLACSSYFELAGEADLLTFDEQRDRVKAIWDDAKYSETPGVADSARGLLDAYTNDPDALADRINEMGDVCRTNVDPL